MLQIGDNIIHENFGKGQVVDLAIYPDEQIYLEIHFEKDAKGKTRMFTFDSLKPHMI